MLLDFFLNTIKQGLKNFIIILCCVCLIYKLKRTSNLTSLTAYAIYYYSDSLTLTDSVQ